MPARIDVPDSRYQSERCLGSAETDLIFAEGCEFAVEVSEGRSLKTLQTATRLISGRHKDASLSTCREAAVFASGMLYGLRIAQGLES